MNIVKNSSLLSSVVLMVEGVVPSNAPESVKSIISLAKKSNKIAEGKNTTLVLDNISSDALNAVGVVSIDKMDKLTPRAVQLLFGKVLREIQKKEIKKVAVYMDEKFANCDKMLTALMSVPTLVNYDFNYYKSSSKDKSFEAVEFVLEKDASDIMEEAKAISKATTIARELVNQPQRYMTPVRLAKEAANLGEEYGVKTIILSKDEAAKLGMNTFLAVAQGSTDEPVVIVMRYEGNPNSDKNIALVGKGLMFDSGGYNIKSNMYTMHGDMGGSAAVIGAMTAIASQKLKANVTVVVAACKNMINSEAYVAGDVVTSMSGKTIEVLNTDAEGRLTLADAVTYAIREEKADIVIDIATLTGAASYAVGSKSSAILTDDEDLLKAVTEAGVSACEKVWRLDFDRELSFALESDVADLKNVNLGGTQGAGTALGGMFVEKFAEDKPFLHIDIASVNWVSAVDGLYSKGATGYGAALLYHTVKNLAK